MIEPIDFLRDPTESRLRREMNNIVGSYTHSWDLLAELLQNSVDAIRTHISTHNESEHTIDIIINQKERSVTIRDSGVGIAPENIKELLAPNGSNKSSQTDLIGEKGVGLAFVIFSANYFKITTHSTSGKFSGEIVDASRWREEKSELPALTVLNSEEGNSPLDASQTYTKIIARDIGYEENDNPDSIFCLGKSAIICMLRTKTAIGSTLKKPENIKVTFELIDRDGRSNKTKIDFKYMYPVELLGKGKWYEYSDLLEKMPHWSDRDKAKRLKGCGILKEGVEHRANREIHYSAFFASSRQTWVDINKMNEFVATAADGTEQFLYEAAITLATKGMPTGVTLDAPLSGQTGYWPNIHILIQDDSLQFDLGRKSIPGPTQHMLKKIAKNIFDDLAKFAKFMSVKSTISANPALSQHAKNERFDELDKIPDLRIKNIPYIKHPDSQESGVVAIFHELAATKQLKGYRVLKTGYKETYDLWGKYEVSENNIGKNIQHRPVGKLIPIVIEFKYSLTDILDDLNNDIKRFGDIDLLICWDIDEKKFRKHHIDIDIVSSDDAFFFGTNYKISLPATMNLGDAGEKPIISLRQFIDDIAKGH